jgi:hypothetical protein
MYLVGGMIRGFEMYFCEASVKGDCRVACGSSQCPLLGEGFAFARE